MKIFVSWSGETSHQVALVLKDWLPLIKSEFEPWVSPEIFQKDRNWGHELSKQLEEMSFGIFCLDESNLDSKWFHYEAGALSKCINMDSVAPLLFDVKKNQIMGPLSQFPLTTFEKEDLLKLLLKMLAASTATPIINQKLYKKLYKYDEKQVEKNLETTWGSLTEKLAAISTPDRRD